MQEVPPAPQLLSHAGCCDLFCARSRSSHPPTTARVRADSLGLGVKKPRKICPRQKYRHIMSLITR